MRRSGRVICVQNTPGETPGEDKGHLLPHGSTVFLEVELQKSPQSSIVT